MGKRYEGNFWEPDNNWFLHLGGSCTGVDHLVKFHQALPLTICPLFSRCHTRKKLTLKTSENQIIEQWELKLCMKLKCKIYLDHRVSWLVKRMSSSYFYWVYLYSPLEQNNIGKPYVLIALYLTNIRNNQNCGKLFDVF